MIQNLANYVWYNKKFVLSQDANFHVSNYGLHYAASVFEGERLYNGKFFKLYEHSKRLIDSAKLLGLDIKYSVQDIMNATENLVKKNQLVNAYIRPIAWKRSDFLKLLSKQEGENSVVDIAIIALNSQTDDNFQSLNLYVSSWNKNSPNSIPMQSKCSAHYLTSSLAKQEAFLHGYDDCLLLTSEGFIAESSVSNIFFIKGNLLITPSTKYCLNGITRNTVINEIAPIYNLKVEESDSIRLSDLKDFDESFITGTSVEIKNISSIVCQNNKYLFPQDYITRNIRDYYFKIVNKI